MQFLVLGPLRALKADGTDVTPRGQRTLDLLAALLLRRRQPVDPQVLLELVWGDEAPNLDVSAVHTVIARLRRALGAEAIGTTPRGYQLSSDWTVDEDRFTSTVTHARRLDAPGAAARAFAEALALWRADHAYDDVHEALVAAERSRLTELRDNAREALAQALLDTGDPADAERALAEAELLIAGDPLRERAHELAMTANARLGRQADALSAFERLRVLLREELGIDPGPRAAALQAQLLAQDPGLTGAAGPRPASERRALPAAPLTALIDREGELDELIRTIGERRLVTLLGPGGVGKSRLLAEACLRMAESATVGYVDLATADVTDDSDLCEAIGHALGLTHAGDISTVSGLAEVIAGSAIHLFIDEAERAIEPTAAVVAALLGACPQLRVVATSRRPLDVVGERQQVLAPLGCPEPGASVTEIQTSPAVRLLLDRLQDHIPELDLDSDNAQRLSRLVHRVDGPPLAVELLARYADARSLTELDAASGSLLDLTGEPDRPQRHRTLRDTIVWSAAALPPEHRQTLRRLGVFTGSFDADAAVAVAGQGPEAREALRTLARDALVQVGRERSGLRLRLLRVVRELSLEGLAADGGLETARARHRRWYADRWRDAPRSDDLLRDVRDNYPDFVQALRTSLEDRDPTTTAVLAITLARFWAFADMTGAGLRWLGRVLASALLTDVERARVLTMRAVITVHSDPGAALADLEAARPTLENAADHHWLFTVHSNLALHHLGCANGPGTLAAAGAAADLAMRLGDRRRADALALLALAQAVHEPQLARASIGTAWELALESGSLATLETTANNLFLALAQLGEEADAAALLATLEERLPTSERPLCILLVQGWNHLLHGRHREALASFAHASATHPDTVSDSPATEIYFGAGCALQGLGHRSGPAVMAGAAVLFDRVGTTLLPWQWRLVEAATPLPAPPASSVVPETTRDLGVRLARHVVEAADELSDLTVSGSTP